MQLSGLELRYLINEANLKIGPGYYISDITGVTRFAILLKLHHPREADILLMISTQGLWITPTRFKTVEQNPLVSVLSREIGRSKVMGLDQMGTERIFIVRFKNDSQMDRFLIVEIFGDGNIILCDSEMNIIGVLNPIAVRHRALKIGLKYVFPPKRGEDVLDIKLEQLINSKDAPQYREINVARWLGTFTSMPKRFVEEIIRRSKIPTQVTVSQLSRDEVKSIFSNTKEVVNDVVTGTNHVPTIVIDSNGNPVDAFPIDTHGNTTSELKQVPSYMEAVDLVLGAQIMKIAKGQKTLGFEQQLANLQHDLEQQEKAREEVILKAISLRNLARELMNLNQSEVYLNGDAQFDTVIQNHNARIIKEKGKEYVELGEQYIPFTHNLPKLASSLFARAKELEHGTKTIEEASQKIKVRLDDLRNKATKIESKIQFRKQETKEWYERYRWCSTSDGFLLVGGRDASSNSAIIRKHMTDSDLVFHAEIHGSPFFLLKNSKGKSYSDESTLQAAQATVSFSRAWKEGLSSADAYWVLPSQVKKGAPTGQYLSKGAFVIEGKRNYVKDVELKLAVGIITQGKDKYSIMCGPHLALLSISNLNVTLIPGGIDVVTTTKKIKSEFINALSASDGSLLDYIKQIPIDELAKIMPPGPSKIIAIRRGDSISTSQGNLAK